VNLYDDRREQADLADDLAPYPKKRPGGFFNELARTVLLVLVIYLAANLTIPRYEVEGHSMEPNFHDQDRIVVSRLSYWLGEPQRGDVVVLDLDGQTDLLKRIIGLPGERVQIIEGQVYINGAAIHEPYVAALCATYSCRDREWVLADDEYFVLGDNRNHSRDSHDFGPINRSQIVGKVVLSYWPPTDWSIILDPKY
jgi:signal peptidase I